MYNNLNNSFYDEGVRNNKNEHSYNNDLTFKSIRLESPVSIYLANWSPMIINKIIASIDYNFWLKHLDQVNGPTNKMK